MTDAMDSTALIELLRKFGHDVRAPLGALISTSDMLGQGVYDPLTTKQTKATDRLQRSGRRALAMLEDFITYIKADAGQLDIADSVFDPRAQLEDWCVQVKPTVEHKTLSMRLASAENLPTSLRGDETLISRVIMALLWNAVAYTHQGEIFIESTWTADNQWMISIQDSGKGIAPDDLPNIFEPFWRGSERPVVPTACAGLGLPLAAALVKQMQGQLFLKQSSSQGSTFCVQLPLKAA